MLKARLFFLTLAGVLPALTVLFSFAQDPQAPPASREAVQAVKGFRVPKGMKAELFAAEPLLAHPVAFCFDEKGRCYVAETYRLHHGVTDNRQHMYWLDDDLASRTVA